MVKEKWTKVAEENELKEGIPAQIEIGQEAILLVRIDGKIHAYGNQCPHYGAPLGDGHLSNQELTCPWHNARFNMKDGKMIAPPALDDIPVYPVKIENNEVYIGEAEKPEITMPEGDDERTFLIVGAGAAGNTAAETLRKAGFAGRIILLTSENDVPYDRPNLSKMYMSGEAPASWIPLRNNEFYDRLEIELMTKKQVISLNISDNSVDLADGENISFDKCLLATGGIPKKLNILDSSMDNVFYLRSFEDARNITENIDDMSDILVVGAGFIGTEVAASLRARELNVHLVAPEKFPMEKLFGKEVGKRIKKLHTENGVTLHMGTTLEKVEGEENVEQVVLSDGTSLKVDMVIAGLGIEPAVDYLRETDLLENGAVPVNEHLQTKAENIYAAGDIAAVLDPNTGDRTRVEHWAVAEREGQHAAKAMLGHVKPYDEVPFFWTRQFGVSIKSVGSAKEFNKIAYRGDVAEEDFLAGYYQNGQLRAAVTMGRNDELYAIEKIMKARSSISLEQFKKYDLT